MEQLLSEVLSAAYAFVKMSINGFFSMLGGVFSYFYAVFQKSINPKLITFALWVALAFGVGMVFGEFIEYTPDYVQANSHGALILVGAFWQKVLTWGKDNYLKLFIK